MYGQPDQADIMLVPPSLNTDLSTSSKVEPWTSYDYLIGGANPKLSSATCLYFDGIPQNFDLRQVLDLVTDWFLKFDSKPKVLLVGGDKQILSPRYSMRTLREVDSDRKVHRAIETVEFFPKGRTTVDDTWRPSIYFARSLRAPQSAFFSINATLSEQDAVALLLDGDRLFKSCAAYGFLFPAWFSPLGYYWGISVEPSYRALGAWGGRESRRLSHWRDNTAIGILQNGERRFYRACDGYLRDVYPLMLLGERHLARRLDDGRLADALSSLGHVSAECGKVLWRVGNESLAHAQQLLDANDVTLSGRRLEL